MYSLRGKMQGCFVAHKDSNWMNSRQEHSMLDGKCYQHCAEHSFGDHF